MIRLQNRASTHPRDEEPAAAGALRTDLRGLVTLEVIQTVLGLGVLVVIAVRAVLVTDDHAVAVALALADALALVFLALAFRLRMGQELLRDDLRMIELRRQMESTRSSERCGGSPYRDRATLDDDPPRIPVTVPRRWPASLFHLGLACVMFTAGPLALQRLFEARAEAVDEPSTDEQDAPPNGHVHFSEESEWQTVERTTVTASESDGDPRW